MTSEENSGTTFSFGANNGTMTVNNACEVTNTWNNCNFGLNDSIPRDEDGKCVYNISLQG